MEKLKFKNLATVGDVLSPEELKRVYGGSGSGSNNGSLKPECICVYSVGVYPYDYDVSEIIPNIETGPACFSACNNKCNYDWNFHSCEEIFRYVPK